VTLLQLLQELQVGGTSVATHLRVEDAPL